MHIFVLCTLMVPLHFSFCGNEACSQEAELTSHGFRLPTQSRWQPSPSGLLYWASSGNFLLAFRDNVSVPFSGVKMGLIAHPKMLVINYYLPCNNPEVHSSHSPQNLLSNNVQRKHQRRIHILYGSVLGIQVMWLSGLCTLWATWTCHVCHVLEAKYKHFRRNSFKIFHL